MTNSRNRNTVLALLVVFSGLIVWFYFFDQPKEAVAPSVPDKPTISWSSVIVREAEFGMPVSEVVLKVNGKELALGEADGSCAHSSLDLLSNQISSYLCWWAGGGSEFAVFQEGQGLVVKKGVVEEGGADYEGFRGNFETVVIVPR